MGAHSAPIIESPKTISTTGAFTAVAMALGAAVSFGMVDAGVAEAAVPTATTADLDAIAQCESGGNPQASNGSHFGAFQFDLATWRSVGGTGDPRSATLSEQYARAQTLMNQRGTQPWAASQSCWQGKSTPSPAQVIVKPSPVKRIPQVVAPKVAKPTPTPTIPKLTGVVNAAEATPLFDAAVSTVVGSGLHVVKRGDNLTDIAKAKGLPGAAHLYNLNRHILSNPDKIYPGQVLRLT